MAQYIRPTMQDMLDTLPPDEQAELLILIGRAAAERGASAGNNDD
jgi:hypothetical protein